MTNAAQDILARARQRAQAAGLPFEGALTPQEANELWQSVPDAKLIDVRTKAEWDWVGRIPGAVMIEWFAWPGAVQNAGFLDELKARVGEEDLAMFICRTQNRSLKAALLAAQAGFKHAFLITEGFEGEADPQGHRSTVNGWRKAGLPWTQG